MSIFTAQLAGFSAQHHLLSKFNEGISAFSRHSATITDDILKQKPEQKLWTLLVLGRAVAKILEILRSQDQILFFFHSYQYSSVLC